MAFCKQCGSQVGEKSKFCRECGNSIRQMEPVAHPMGESQALAASAAPARMSLKTKIWILSVVVFLILCTAAYKTGEHFTSKERLVGELETALNHKDMKKTAALLVPGDKRLSINEKSLMAFKNYLDSEPDEQKRLIQELSEQAKEFDRKGNDPESGAYRGYIHLEKKGKKLLIYDNYSLVIEPVFVTLETNYKDAALYVGEQQVGAADKPNYEQKFGPYLPGRYKLAAKLSTDLVDLVHSEDMNLLDQDADYRSSLTLDGEDVTVETGLGEAKDVKGTVIINGKDTGMNPFKQTTFGPVTTDGSMKMSIQSTFPWGTLTTEDTPINSDYIEINPAADGAFVQSIMDLIVKNNQQELIAYTSGDVQKMDVATDAFKENVRQSIIKDREYRNYYQGKYLGSTFALNSIRLNQTEGHWECTMGANIRMMEDRFYNDDAPKLEESSKSVKVTLVYNDQNKVWYVDSIRETYGFDRERTKDMVSQDPGIYTSSWAPQSAAAAASASVQGLDYSGTQSFMNEYLSTSVAAINNRSFGQVAYLIDPAGPAYKESANYITHLESKGITEDLNSFELLGLSKNKDGSIKAVTSEAYTIYYQDGSVKNKKFVSEYKLVTIDGALMVHQLISTKEQK
ncbi:zinc ribbon domain-containing protein [Paenibacillus azoreducens]|uniref:zinc ribbon domain-containing protein n=1 Tax=Paenibacillus azoreducens TaxID=116718 RepID=UPI0039F52543